MTPTLMGRIQSRIFLVAVFGCLWSIVVFPLLLLTGPSFGAALSGVLRALVGVTVLGVLWEFLYHALQQLRWEKDWPSLFSLVLGIPEGIVLYLFVSDIPLSTFVLHFATTWIVIWLAAHGPMRVLLHRWRFHGGRVL